MKKFQALGRSLSKAEQKNIMGGVTQCYTCWCSNAPMNWTDCSGGTFYEVIAGADSYCRAGSSGGGACTQTEQDT